MNILNNAINFTQEGGVEVNVSWEPKVSDLEGEKTSEDFKIDEVIEFADFSNLHLLNYEFIFSKYEGIE